MARDEEHAEIRRRFGEAANMTLGRLQAWLTTQDSRSVGGVGDGREARASAEESVCRQSGERIVAIKRKTVAELTEDDYDGMAKVIAYVKRHTAQGGPKDDKAHSRWRYSLMNWGHDPLST